MTMKSRCARETRLILHWAAPQTPKPPSAIMANETANQTSPLVTTSRSLRPKDGIITETIAYSGATPDQSGVADLRRRSGKTALISSSTMLPQAMAKPAMMSCMHQVARRSSLHPSSNTIKRNDLFSPKDFTLSENGELRAQQPRSPVRGTGKQSIVYRSGSGQGRNFRFYPRHCWQGDPPARMHRCRSQQTLSALGRMSQSRKRERNLCVKSSSLTTVPCSKKLTSYNLSDEYQARQTTAPAHRAHHR